MSEHNETAPASRRNPLIWIVLIVVGLILFVLVSGDRARQPGNASLDTTAQASGAAQPIEVAAATEASDSAQPAEVAAVTEMSDEVIVASIDESPVEENSGTIDRSLLVPPGMRARQYIVQLRETGKPYPLSQVFDKAQTYQLEGSLADAHLLFFFAARENHLPAMMVMAEMSDPLRFDASDSLLDEADAIQALKWYRKAADLGQAQASARLEELAAWADTAANAGDPEARQLLLNIQ